MGTRLELHDLLLSLLGSNNVYFQPPPSIQMQYPCIVYSLDYMHKDSADNDTYTFEKRYSITVIDRNPDSVIPDSIIKLPKCVFERRLVADNLNHTIFNLYY